MSYVKISQILNGIENHLITLELNNDLTDSEALSEMTQFIYQGDKKVYLNDDTHGVVLYPQHGPVKVSIPGTC